MSTGYGYWVTANANTTLSGSGSLFTSTTTPPSRTVQSGWNLLGYYQLPGQSSSNATSSFSSISGYTTVIGYDNQTGVFKTVSSILPGDAFWLGIPSTGTYYPSYSFSSGNGSATFGAPQTPGTVSVTKATNSPSSNVSVGASNVKLASFEMMASNEDVKVENLNVRANTSRPGGLDNGKVFINGVQVGSTKDLTDATDVNFTFGSSFILQKNVSATVDIYADAKTTTGAAFSNNDTATVSIGQGSANGQGQVTLSTIDVPTSAVVANTITISASSLTSAKYSGYSNQTTIAGTNNARLGSFTLSTGSMESVNVNTITVALSADESATITDLMLKDNATGTQIGTTKATPSTSNAFSVNFNIAASGTKVVDVYGNIKSGANVGQWIATVVDVSGTGSVTGSAISGATATDLQTITIGSAILTATVGTSPDNANVIAGSSMVKVGSFDFAAQYSGYTIDKIKVKISANAATAVSSITLRYPNANGVSTDTVQSIVGSSGSQSHATSTFTGLTFYVPSGTTKKLDVYVNLSTIQNDGDSGKSVSVVLDADEGFRATDSSGSTKTLLANSDIASNDTSGKGTMYVRKSIPTLSAVALDTSTLSNGSNKVLGRMKITADAAGDISWNKLVFTVNKTAALTLGATSTIALWQGPSQIAGIFATTTGSHEAQLQAFTTSATSGALVFVPTSEQQVSAGTSITYELRGTVGGISSAGGYSFDVSIWNLSTSATTGTASEIGVTAVIDPSFTWSDRSSVALVHSLTTSDWTNDYLVRTLPLTVGNLSVSI